VYTNSYTDLPERFFQRIQPEQFPAPELVVFNNDLANELGLNFANEDEAAQILSGQKLLPGSEPIAQAYAGCQFGHFVPQLGDGRAHLLGEVKGFDIQLKGSGKSKFSRGGDGRSPLGPVIREFVISEAMHALGVPTTRALGVITTGEDVLRHYGLEPGGILARVADSHLRVGTFQFFHNLGDLEALEILTNFAIQRHYQEISSADLSDRCVELVRAVAVKQGELVAKWYGVGFVHGVMNTDNCSIAGLTIDYGPCAFLDSFKVMKVFSSIDHQGRYAYGNQMGIAKWNVMRLADCLLPLIADDPAVARSKVTEALDEVFSNFPTKVYLEFGRKLGLSEFHPGLDSLVASFLRYLEANSLDFTLSFYNLKNLYEGESDFFPMSPVLEAFLNQWKELYPDPAQMASLNPCVIPRNHQIENVIQHANDGQYESLYEIWEALKNPFDVSTKHLHLMDPPRSEEQVYQTFCGT